MQLNPAIQTTVNFIDTIDSNQPNMQLNPAIPHTIK
jgi:hypothetical protein